MQELSKYNVTHHLPAEAVESWANGPLALSQQDDQADLWTYWSAIWRHLGLILGLFFVVELLTAAVVANMTPLYTGLSTILIDDRSPQVLGNPSPNEGSESESFFDNFYKTQYAILQSRSLAARVIKEMRLDHSPYLVVPVAAKKTRFSFGEWQWPWAHPLSKQSDNSILGVKSDVIDNYLADLTIRPEFGTRLVMVAFSSPNAALSARVANAHVQAYIREGWDRHAQSSETEHRFLETKLVELEKRIEKSERALNDYRRERGIVVFSPDTKGQIDDRDQMADERMSELNRAVVQAETQRISLQAEVETIKAGQYDSLPAVVNTALIQDLKSQASKLEGQYANMANEYTPDWPPVAQLRAQLLEVQKREQKEIRKIVDSIKVRYQAAVDQENQLKTELEAEKARAMSLKDASLRDVILAREVDTNRALYQNVLERIKLLGVASESRVTNVSIIDAAEVPAKPSSPKKRLCLVLSGVLALLIGIATALAVEGNDHGLKNADQVQRYLHLPNLATVLHFASPRVKSLRVSQVLSLPWRDSAQPGEERDASPARALLSAAGDAYRAVRTGILLSRSETLPRLFSLPAQQAVRARA